MAHSTFDLFQWMDEDVARAFTTVVSRRRYAAGQMIYVQDEPGREMFRLITGSVRVSVGRSDGREVIYLLFEPGDCFGDSSLVDGGLRPHTAEALSDVEVDILHLPDFNRLRAQHRGFDDALLKLLARQMRAVSTQYEEASLNNLTSRVAGRILVAARSFGAAVDGGVRISLRLSQSEIASMVGASRQSVNKIIRRFQSQGVLTIDHGAILVRDFALLSRAASSGR
jgi:CRP-like cAMP-binding protein